jgi:V/A-type H+/Na+-transporting ATPase subunit B
MELLTREYNTVSGVHGPLLIVEDVRELAYGSIVRILMPDKTTKTGQVIEITEKHAVIQVFEETIGLDVAITKIRFLEDCARISLSADMLGRIFDGKGEPRDGLPPIVPEERRPIIGSAINPVAREKPEDFIQSGISTIDGLNTLVRGQKLPIFSGAGLPANQIAAQIVAQSKVLGETEEFAVVFAGIGVTMREAAFFIQSFEETGALEKAVVFMNYANDPTIERLLTPRCALTAAEFLAYEKDMQILVILTDMTNYCEALREVGTAREEVPGRRGYPGYMYTDLSQIYERAGKIKDKKGSITQIPILTMPDDDITHPIADLTGYITEGQLVLSRALHRKGIYPPMDVMPCLSRLMNNGIGEKRTRGDHRNVADQLYAAYARGNELRKLVAIIGEEALSDLDKLYLKFSDDFENQYIGQGVTNRAIEETLSLSWRLLSRFPKGELKRIAQKYIEKYYIAKEKE